jgi:isopropylmalate/homocitrate/citramalate synthase
LANEIARGIVEWIQKLESSSPPRMKTIKLTIFDETLRDGEQQVGIFFDTETKHNLAQLITATGVHGIAIMPAIHSTEAQLTKNLIDRGLKHLIVASTMMGQKYIDRSLECGVEKIILFHGISDRLLWLRNSKLRHLLPNFETEETGEIIQQIRQQMLDTVLANLEYAVSQGLKVCFAAEDATRADFDFLVTCINKFQAYIEQFLLCDTVGILTPETTKNWLRNLIEFTHNRTPLTVHFHNDRGLALENTIQAIIAGATGISGTFGGIGERAGNVAIEQVLNGLKLRYGWQVSGINYQAFDRILAYQKQHNIVANQPYSLETLRCETGIHVDSLMRDRNSYYLFPHGKPEVWFGKFSGAANFKYLFEKELKYPLKAQKYQEFRDLIKEISIKEKRSFSTNEVLEILKDYL